MRQEFKGYGVFFFIVGLILLVVAGVFAGKEQTMSSIAACGFAIGGSICFLAAALVYVGDRIAAFGEQKKNVAPPSDKPDAAAS